MTPSQYEMFLALVLRYGLELVLMAVEEWVSSESDKLADPQGVASQIPAAQARYNRLEIKGRMAV